MPEASVPTACPHCGEVHPERLLVCPHTDEVLPLRGRVLDDKFRLLRELGRGGMATVWLAEHLVVEREVAIKIVRPELAASEAIRGRFRGEARAAGRIAHPNVCEILDFGIGAVGPFIVMERLQGISLGELLRRVGRLTPGQLLAIMRPALGALAAAHERGVIHRDLKPENVFLHEFGNPALTVKLMDFGIAKFIDGTVNVETETGTVIGTPHYMAPEQFSTARPLGVTTDIWAIGVMLYRGLSGREPFKDKTLPSTLARVIHEPSPRLERKPLPLCDIVDRCLAKAPEDRFQDVPSLLAALEAAGIPEEPLPTNVDEPVRPPPVTFGHPDPDISEVRTSLRPPPGRGRLRWVLIGVASTVVVAGLGWASAMSLFGSGEKVRASVAQVRLDPPDASGDFVRQATDPEDDPAPPDPEDAVRELPEDDPAPPDPIPTTSDTPPADEALVRWDDWVGSTVLGPMTTQYRARKYCESLAARSEAGFDDWKLANPKVARGLASVEGLPASNYWTSARWRGRVRVLRIPSGAMTSKDAKAEIARPLCVAFSPLDPASPPE